MKHSVNTVDYFSKGYKVTYSSQS